MTADVAAGSGNRRPTYLIESVDNALRLLHLFLVRDRIRVSEAALELDVAVSTAHRLLAMLQYHGFVAQDSRTHEYIPGPDLIRFGLSAIRQFDIREQARPIMEDLCGLVNETVALGILQRSDVLYLDGVESTRALRVAVRTGALIPAHTMAMGKVLLAHLSASAFDAIYPSDVLSRATEKTIVSKAELRAEFPSIRRRGFAQSRGESESGVASIAVPVVNGAGALRATMSIAAPAQRATTERMRSWWPLLRTAAARLGAASQ